MLVYGHWYLRLCTTGALRVPYAQGYKPGLTPDFVRDLHLIWYEIILFRFCESHSEPTLTTCICAARTNSRIVCFRICWSDALYSNCTSPRFITFAGEGSSICQEV